MIERRPAVAWVAIDHDGEPLAATVEPKAGHWSHGTLRVARCVEITDAEREALKAAIRNYKFNCDGYGGSDEKTLATLGGLLARLGGAT